MHYGGDMEVKTILKFNGKDNIWICGVCDCENPDTLSKCMVCGGKKKTYIPQEKLICELTYEGVEHTDAKGHSCINVRKVAIAVLIAVILAGAILIGVNQYTESNYSRDYQLACKMIDDGNYETAVELLTELPLTYADTANKYKEAKYNLAYEYLNSDRYEEASEMFLDESCYEIPEGTENIGNHSLDGTRLKALIIPGTIKQINRFAGDEDALKTVFYRGTEEDWNSITFDRWFDRPEYTPALKTAEKKFEYNGVPAVSGVMRNCFL